MTVVRVVDIADRPVTEPKDPGAAPMLQWVKLADLMIDESYQRGLAKSNWRHIERIAAAFSWSKFSPVFCAPIPGGKYAIIDGQHRAHAAALCGFEEVPAQIVQMTKPEQASAFAAINGGVIKVTTWQLFKSALEAGDAWAVAADAAVSAAGCKLMTANAATDARKPREVYAFREIRRQMDAGRAASVTVALAAVAQSEAGDDVETWGDNVLRPWIIAVSDRPNLSDAKALAEVFDSFDCFDALDRTDQFIRQCRRAGGQTAPRHELVAAEFGTAIDAALLPSRIRAAE